TGSAIAPLTLPLSLLLFNDTSPPAIYTLSLHDALPISLQARLIADLVDLSRLGRGRLSLQLDTVDLRVVIDAAVDALTVTAGARSEEHTSELQSRGHLVCRLLLEKKKNIHYTPIANTTH